MDYLPFGEQIAGGHGTTAQFTGLQFDAESANGLYDTPAGKYAPNLGRWTTPDPANLPTASVFNPQSWNRYAYVLKDKPRISPNLDIAFGCCRTISGRHPAMLSPRVWYRKRHD